MAEPFDVVYPPRVLEAFEDIYRAARQVGVEAKVEEAAKVIDENLRSAPREFGDPVFSYRGMKATLFQRIVLPLYVCYAVHEEQHVVFVKSIQEIAHAEVLIRSSDNFKLPQSR